MKKILIVLPLLLMATPAHAGFLLGYMIGASGSRSSGSAASSPKVDFMGIPFFCLQYDKYEDYANCRRPSAIAIDWVISDSQAEYKDERSMIVRDFMTREWNALKLLEKQGRIPPTPDAKGE